MAATGQHCMWMVDLLGHAVYVHEAKDLSKTMSCEPNSSVWMAFSMLAEFMVMWRWENALQKQVLEHGDPETGEHIGKTSSGIESLEMAWAMSCCQTSLLLTSEIEEATEEKDADQTAGVREENRCIVVCDQAHCHINGICAELFW
jgi:hypothetical protein